MARNVIHWSPKEKESVIKEYHRMKTAEPKTASRDVWLSAQLILPENRRRTMASQATCGLNKEYQEMVDCGWFIHAAAVDAQQADILDDVQAKVTPKASKPAMFAMSALQMISAPVPHTPAPAPVQEEQQPVANKIVEKIVEAVKSESTIDFMLKALVQNIVELELSKFETRQMNMLDEHQHHIRAMFDVQIAKLVDLWEPAKQTNRLQVEIKDSRSKGELTGDHKRPVENVVDDLMNRRPLPEKACGEPPEPKPKKFKVFFAGGINKDFQTLVTSMPNVEFTHGDGKNPRSITMPPSTDLVICCKFLGHSTMNSLKTEYGERFKFVKKGGLTTIKQTIRDYFGARLHSNGATT